MEYGQTNQTREYDCRPAHSKPESSELVFSRPVHQTRLDFALEEVAELKAPQIVEPEPENLTPALSESLSIRPKTQEDVLKLADNALGILEAELKAGKSETLLKFLNTMSQFHSYSFNNVMLIAFQFPEATHVAGFQAWKQLGRFVKKDEQGIRILAPIIIKKKSEGENKVESENKDEEPESRKALVGFKVVSVFDISQTDGEPLPDIGSVDGDPGENLKKLEDLIRSKGIKLAYEPLFGPEGLSKGGEILVEPNLGAAKTFAVLAHELAHEMLHKAEKREGTTKTQRELEAEAVAFVVCQAFEIESRHHTANYIQLYDGNVEALGESLNVIRETSAQIINSICNSDVINK